MDLGLKGLSVIVTGGSRGLGLEVAQLFAAEGANLTICGRDPEALQKVAVQVKSVGVEVVTIPLDLTEAGSVDRVVSQTVTAFGRLDVLVNNAAGSVAASALGSTGDVLLERVQHKAMPSIRAAQLAVPHMINGGGGAIIFIGGLSARAPFGRYGPFMAMTGSDTGVAQGVGNALISNYAKHLSDEIGASGITVNVVHPGFISTDRGKARPGQYASREGRSFEEAEIDMISAHPINRLVTPADVAPIVVFLASNQARAITGQSIAVDGGLACVVSY